MKKTWKIFAFGAGFIIFILAAVTIIAATASPEEAYFPKHSTFFTDRFGTHAFNRLLLSLGFETEKNYLALDEVEDYGFNNYLFIGPDDYFNSDEKDSLRSYIEQGSYALCVPKRGNNFLEDLGVELKTSPDETRYLRGSLSLTPTSPDPLFESFDKLKYARKEDPESYLNKRMNGDFSYHLVCDSLPLMPLMEADGEVHIGYIPLGAGRIYLLSHPYLFTNEGLKKQDNAQFAVALMEKIEKEHPGRLIFDEYHHGFRMEPVASPFNIKEVRWMTWALIASFVLLIVSIARRSAQPVPIYKEPRRTIAEYIASIGHLYYKKNGTWFVYREIAERFQNHVSQSMGFLRKEDLKNLFEVEERASSKWGKVSAKELRELLKIVQTEVEKPEKEGKELYDIIRRIRKFSIKHKLD